MPTTPRAFATSPLAIHPNPGYDLVSWSRTYSQLHLDLGTGDGRYAVQLAQSASGQAVIGVDTCLDQLCVPTRLLPANIRFVTADALQFDHPAGMKANAITVNFPYGSLLRELVNGSGALIERFDHSLATGGRLDVRVNAQALNAMGLDPDAGHLAIAAALRAMNGVRITSRPMLQTELRSFPSSWAKRLGFGRPTTAHWISAVRVTG